MKPRSWQRSPCDFLWLDDAPGTAVPPTARAPSHARPRVAPVIPEWADPRVCLPEFNERRRYPSYWAERAFRILFKFRGNVPLDLMFYLRSIQEDWNEEAWIRYRRTWCTR